MTTLHTENQQSHTTAPASAGPHTVGRMMRVSVILLLAIMTAASCRTKNDEQATPRQEAPSGSQGAHGGGPSAGGVSWTIPGRWQAGAERTVRVATYIIPAAEGDPAGGECAVFHFGPGQGGDIPSNIDRWVGQFENPSAPKQSTVESNGLRITTVSTTGTFLAPAGPMMESQGKMQNYSLLAQVRQLKNIFNHFTL